MARMPYPGAFYPGETYPGVSRSYVTPYGEWEYVADPEEQRAVREAFGKTTFSAMVDNKVAGATYTVDIGGVPGKYDDEFFDGTEAPEGLFSSSWAGAPDDSISLLSANTFDTVVDYTKSKFIKAYVSDEQPLRGTRSLRIVPVSPEPNYSTGTVQGTSVAIRIPAGGSGIFGVRVRTEGRFEQPLSLATSALNAGIKTTYAEQGTTTLTITVNGSSSPRTVYLHLPGDYFNGAITIDELIFTLGSNKVKYFDGSVPDDPDIDYRWEGVAHNSRSMYDIIRTIDSATGVFNPLAVQSLQWKYNRNFSLRLMAGGTFITALSLPTGMVPGKTYTVSVVRKLNEDIPTDEIDPSSGLYAGANLSMSVGNSAGDLIPYSSGVIPKAGVERLSITLTIPENVQFFYIVLQGSKYADVWYDALMISEGVAVEDYFDGNTFGAEWLGTPEMSISHVRPVIPRSGGYPLKKFVSSYADRMGEIDELVARISYLPEDVRHEAELYGYDTSDRVVPLGATSDLVDPRTADDEWIPWLGQILGINPNEVSVDELRTAILSGLTGMVAGTRRAIASAVRAIMTGDSEKRSVRIYPHTKTLDAIGEGTQWDLLVVTPVEQNLTLQQVRDAIERAGAKPAGVLIHHVSKSTTWADLHQVLPTWAMWNDKKWETIEEAGFGI